MTEAQIAKMMATLKSSREEAIEVIREDEEIDKMPMSQVDDDLTPEQKKAKKDATKTTGDKRKRSYTFTKRERKPDEEKAEIIAKIAEFLAENANYCVEIVKKEGEIALKVGENEYSVNLVKHRTAKK